MRDPLPATERPRGRPSGERRGAELAIFVVTALGAFMASLDLSIVNVAFPALERSFPHDSRAALAWVITGYSIVFGSLLVTAGRTADRIGRKRVFFAGLAVFSLGSALCGLAPSVSLLVAGRRPGLRCRRHAARFVGSAARRLPERTAFPGRGHVGRGRSPGRGDGAFAGRALDLGGRMALGVLRQPPVGAVAWVLGRRVLVDSQADEVRARPTISGVVLVSTALGCLVLAISEGPTWGWSNAARRGLLRGRRRRRGCLSLPLAPPRGARARPDLFSARSFSVANAATLLYAMGFFAMLLGNILFLTVGVALLDPAGRPGRHARAPGGGGGLRTGRTRGRTGGLPPRCCWSARLLRRRARVVRRPGSARTPPTSHWLPATLITGLGIGLTFPVLSAAAVSSLPPRALRRRQCRQPDRPPGRRRLRRGALLVVILGTPRTAPPPRSTTSATCGGTRPLMAVLSGLGLQPAPPPMLPGRARLIAAEPGDSSRGRFESVARWSSSPVGRRTRLRPRRPPRCRSDLTGAAPDVRRGALSARRRARGGPRHPGARPGRSAPRAGSPVTRLRTVAMVSKAPGRWRCPQRHGDPRLQVTRPVAHNRARTAMGMAAPFTMAPRAAGLATAAAPKGSRAS